jgi:ABC-type multidrug transport system permease subunit
LDQEFLNSRIVKMNDKFKEDVIEKLETAHFTIFIRHFRWPQIISTLSIIGLLLLISQFIQPINWLKSALVYSVAAIPLLFVVYFGTKILRKKEFIPWTLENVHFRYIFVIFNISVVYLQLCSLTYRSFKADGKTLLDYSPLVTTCVLFLGFLLLSTTVQLVVKKIRPAIA